VGLTRAASSEYLGVRGEGKGGKKRQMIILPPCPVWEKKRAESASFFSLFGQREGRGMGDVVPLSPGGGKRGVASHGRGEGRETEELRFVVGSLVRGRKLSMFYYHQKVGQEWGRKSLPIFYFLRGKKGGGEIRFAPRLTNLTHYLKGKKKKQEGGGIYEEGKEIPLAFPQKKRKKLYR